MKLFNNLGFLDSTKLETTKSYYQGKVHQQASKGYSSTGEFRGFKLHILINEKNQICNFFITPANIHDINPVKYWLIKAMWVKIFMVIK